MVETVGVGLVGIGLEEPEGAVGFLCPLVIADLYDLIIGKRKRERMPPALIPYRFFRKKNIPVIFFLLLIGYK